jgi:hypothetical protein
LRASASSATRGPPATGKPGRRWPSWGSRA